MKISKRLSKAEVQFYFQKLYKQGFIKESSRKIRSGVVLVLRNNDKYITVRLMRNGWVNVESN